MSNVHAFNESKVPKQNKKKELVSQSADTRENEILTGLHYHLSCEAAFFEQNNISNLLRPMHLIFHRCPLILS